MNTSFFRHWLSGAVLLFGLNAFAADTYKIDPAHTSIGFSVRHFGINNVKGVFRDFAGVIVMDNNKMTEANGTIQVESLDTGVEKRDEHLRSADFFDATNHPTITFKTKRIEQAEGKAPVLIADFTMRGVTKEVRLPAKLSGPTKDPQGAIRLGLEAKAKLNRKDYGIKYHQVLETGVLAVSDEVDIEINAEAIKQTGVVEKKP